MTARPSSPDYHDVVGRPKTVEKSARIAVRDDGALRLAVVADTHSAPHPAIAKHLRSLCPDALVHAGDIGSLSVLDELARSPRSSRFGATSTFARRRYPTS